MSLNDRIEALARDLARRESSHLDAIEKAQYKAGELHRQVDAAIARFNEVVSLSIPYLEVSVSALRVDDKHLHAVEFDLERGRHRAIVTVKSKGEITLVGPFQSGKTEGPCRSFAFDAEAELQDALAAFLERFLEEAAAP
ncbi:MAG: hypothetical protein V3T64_05875 [Myxococcota bacterium]